MAGMKKDGLHPNCPEDRVLEDVAAGASSPEVERQIVRHISQCDVCGPRFRAYLRIESKAPLSAAETSILSQLKTSSPEYQKRWLEKQGIIPSQAGRRADKKDDPVLPVHPDVHHEIKWWPRLAFAGAGLAAVIAGFIWVPPLLAKMELTRADKTVNAAFAARRTTEMRYPGAPAAPFHPYPVELGPDTPAVSDFDRPELAKAQGVVADKVKSGDPRWLQLQGRISLLKGDSRSLGDAEKMFEAASKKDPNSASLKIDLATAYFERDSKAEHPNLQKTLDLLLEVLHRPNLNNQDRTAALFDLAIAYEKTQAWDLAVDTWNEYLRVEKSGPWAEQAKEHLKEAEGKLPAKKPQGFNQPGFFLKNVANLKAEDAEEYQSIALSEWLPAKVQQQDGESSQALNALSEVMAKQHSDVWLKDFLGALQSTNVAAVEALTAAMKANGAGDYKTAQDQSIKAAALFSEKKNPAGALRAKLEEVYARRRALQGVDCNQLADSLVEELAPTKYRWLQAKAALERSECSNLRGEFTESDKDLKASHDLAEEFGFSVLLLQDIGISAGMKRLRGQCDESWRESVSGLNRYSSGAHVRGERLFQFYSVMLQCALDTGAPYAAEAFIRHELRGPSFPTPIKLKPIAEGMLRIHLANILRARHESTQADEELKKAKLLLELSGTPGKTYEFTAKIETAEIQLKQQDPASALATLETFGELGSDAQEKFLSLNLHRVLGSVYLELGRFGESEAAYRSAIANAEGALAGLKEAGDRLDWLRATDQSYRGLVRVLVAEKKEREALEAWEWYKSRSLMQRLSANPESPEALAAAMPKNFPLLPTVSTAHLIYASFPDGLQIWVVDNKGVRGRWIDVSEQDLARSAREFAEECSDHNSTLDKIAEHGRSLYTLLIRPVASELPQGETLSIEMDRFGNGLPMQALIAPAGHYLAEELPIVSSPGLWVESSLRKPTPISLQDRLLLVDATHSSKVNLEAMQAERDTIERIFPRTRTIDSSRMGTTTLPRDLAVSEIIHFMGHGRTEGHGTALILNDHQLLKSGDLTARLLGHLKLGVLAACSTGVGKKDGFLDTQNLVHSFLSAGVPAVVASRWNVDSNSTDELMRKFYENLGNSKNEAHALYAARKGILKDHPHPYYWAGFDLVGRTL